jgi:hypothetical protein
MEPMVLVVLLVLRRLLFLQLQELAAVAVAHVVVQGVLALRLQPIILKVDPAVVQVGSPSVQQQIQPHCFDIFVSVSGRTVFNGVWLQKY